MSNKLAIPTKDELNQIYQSNKSISKTAKHFNASNPTVRKWLDHYSIKRYTQLEASLFDTNSKKVNIPDKTELESMYKNASIKEMEELYGVGQATIYQWLSDHGIDLLSLSEKVSIGKRNSFNSNFAFTKEIIEKDYDDVQCMNGLAAKYDCSMTTIKKLFKIHDVSARFAKSSIGQIQLAEYIASLDFDVITNDRKLISPFEIDIVIPEKMIAVEYCGIYYHSETWGNKRRGYHKDKQDKCKAKGYTLITVFENEWKTKKEIVKSIIAHKLGKTTNKIPARKTIFRQITYADIKQFEIDNHIQGTRPAQKYYGLYHDGELVLSTSIGIPRYSKQYDWELIRMTIKKGTHVQGGVTKIFKEMNIKDCITYADKRYGSGGSYNSAGFTFVGESDPNYFYFHKSDHNTLHSRNRFQKHKIPNVDMSKTEYENMQEQGYDRIWDCGNFIYAKT